MNGFLADVDAESGKFQRYSSTPVLRS
jgi:hypothetical protein